MKAKLPEISSEKQKLFSRVKRLGGQIGVVERAVAEGDEWRRHPDAAGGDRGPESPEELTEDLISRVRAYLK